MLMAEMQVYECVNCGNTVEVGADESKLPECCGNAMKPAEKLEAWSIPDSMISMNPAMTAGPDRSDQTIDFNCKPNLSPPSFFPFRSSL
jgi:hypothetical protein